jgi:hypothetical protein
MLAALSHKHIAIAGRLGSGPALGPKTKTKTKPGAMGHTAGFVILQSPS